MLNVSSKGFLLLIGLLYWLPALYAQPNATLELKKPKKYENKRLASEKTGEKKFKAPRRFIQNTVTHYNWVFNAENRLNEIVERAKLFHRDDFSKLIPFYNYSLDVTRSDSIQLDSVLYKTNTAILIHDLRNDWIDNLYMLMGKAYFHKKLFDSAYITFQYINYAWAPKEKDGYDRPIGSNAGDEGNAQTVSTKENNSMLKKAVSSPPSRNEALVWQIRTFIEAGEFARASGLIETLKNDPEYPERLQTELHEMRALYFYRQSIFDSAAYYLQLAIPNAPTKNEQARWEYLAAQLYERSNNPESALAFYKEAIKHTYDPVLELYARLNAIRQNRGDSNAIQTNIAELVKMGRKDRYSRYRDIIYFMAAQMEMERKNYPAAKNFLLKSALAADVNMPAGQRGKSFMMLADLSYADGEFADAKRYYDSINTGDPVITDQVAFANRLETLRRIVSYQQVLNRQDSLQQLAAMPEAEREDYVKKLVRKLRKSQGLKDEEQTVQLSGSPDLNNAPAPSLFNSNEKGEWYFYNQSIKSKGYTAFKNKWGNRPNVDNWRRSDAVNASRPLNETASAVQENGISVSDPSDLFSYEGLMKNIPLTPELMAVSNDSIENAKVSLGQEYMEGLEAYPSVINTLKEFPTDFAASERLPEALFYLYYSYKKIGNDLEADRILQLLQKDYAGNIFERRISNAVNKNDPDPAKTQMNAKYDEIYNLFISGNFVEALEQKRIADSLYGTNYWTPQLLYIETIYHIRQRSDEDAKRILQQIISLYPGSAMEEKAVVLLDVLTRRKEIEEYLTNLEIQRPTEETAVVTDTEDTATVKEEKQPAVATIVADEKRQDTLAAILPPSKLPGAIKPIENKPEVVKPEETKEPPSPAKDPVASKIIQAPVPEKSKPVVVNRDSAVASTVAPAPKFFTLIPETSHQVIIVTNKVDPVYVTEARNAFNRYNQSKFYNKKIDLQNESLNDTTKLVVMSGFANATEALEYVETTAPIAAVQIVPWLPAGNYRFIIITPANLELLKTINSMEEYDRFLEKHYPGKFKK